VGKGYAGMTERSNVLGLGPSSPADS